MRVEFCLQGLEGRGAAADQAQVGTARGKACGDRAADAATGAGNDNAQMRKSWIHRPPDASYFDQEYVKHKSEANENPVQNENDRNEPAGSGRYALSVVMPAYNAAATIGEQLQALARQHWSCAWEVIVVNNRSPDNTVAVARQFNDRLPRLRIIDACERQGAAYAMNAGVRAAASEHVAFCDADDVVGAGWVAAMGDGLQQYPFVSGPLETERLNTSPLTRLGPNAQRDGVQAYTTPPFLPHAGAGNMGVRRGVFESVGGFDESFRACFETDFCWKLQLRGIRLTPLRDAVVHVRHRDQAGALLRQAQTYAEYNVALYKRYRPLGMPKLGVKNGIAAWIGLATHVADVASAEHRARYLWELGWRIGRLKGCLKYRVLAP